MKKQFQLKQSFPVNSTIIYHAWLNSEKHSKMTGGEAESSDQEGESFSAWDGYISGINKELIENKKIVQVFRSDTITAQVD